MANNQGDRQLAAEAVSGKALTYEGDFHALFDACGIPAGDYNGRLLAYINTILGTTHTNLPGAQVALAVSSGASGWNEMQGGAIAGPLYTGQVATRCFVPGNTVATTTGWNCRTAHIARDNITALQVVFGNWYTVAGTGDTSQGGTKTVTASIEYPAGVYTRLKFAAANSIVIADGANAVSDSLTITIPKGAVFYSKFYQVNAVGIQYCSAGSPSMNLALGDAVNNSNVDETLTATVDNANGAIVSPLAIIGQTRLPSIGIIGSSRSTGFKDNTVDATGNTGYCRLFGGSFAYTNMAVASDTMAAVISNSAKRRAIISSYCSHLWIDPGLNDLAASVPASTVLSNITTLAASWPKLSRVIVNDEGPYTTSTDSWSTTVNQTANSIEAQRVLLNSGIAALSGYNQIVKVAATETAGSFAWLSTGSVFGYTPDGIHENTALMQYILARNPFNSARVH